jgi:hypothetical protein
MWCHCRRQANYQTEHQLVEPNREARFLGGVRCSSVYSFATVVLGDNFNVSAATTAAASESLQQ